MKGLFLFTIAFGIFTNAQSFFTDNQTSDSLVIKNNELALNSEGLRYSDTLKFSDLSHTSGPDSLTTVSIPKFFHSSYSRFIVPTAFISYGVLTRAWEPLQQLDKSTSDEVREDIGEKVSLDDYLQFVPSVTALGLGLAGVKAEHNFKDRAITTAISFAIMGITVQTLKSTTKIERPDGSGKNSFPSGHTAAAFLGAQLLYREYKDVSLWIPIAGYTVAATTGILRVINNRHWVSDIFTGAGIGMLSAELSYLILPWFSKEERENKKLKNLVLSPITIDSKHMGLGMVYSF